MPEDKVEPREINWRQLLPWTAIFQGFRVALDLNKLLLAALGILAMACAWWFLAIIFYSSKKPDWPSQYLASASNPSAGWAEFKSERQAWNLMYEAAGPADGTERVDVGDLAESQEEFELLKATVDNGTVAREAAAGKRLEDVRADARAHRLKVPVIVGDAKVEKDVSEPVAEKAWILRDPPRKATGRLRTA